MSRGIAGALTPLMALFLYGVGSSCGSSTSDGAAAPSATGSPTFNKDIAPIVFEHCSTCHRPGGGAPFDLLTYEHVRARSGQIAVVTEDRYMPPWHPTRGRGSFVGERGLSDDEIATIGRWAKGGCEEGDAADLPPLPTWPEGWILGTPDLVLELPEAYELAADGADVYRNFVLSVPLDETVYVRAMEINPGDPRVVHHAIMQLDPTRTSRRLDEESPEPGFGDLANMDLPDTVVNTGDSGFFNGWNPGKRPFGGYDDMAWPLDSTYDVVLQLHMRPSGKVERIQPTIGLYYAEKPPTRFPLVIGLRAIDIDIPAGEKNYSVERSYTLPVDVDLLAIQVHAHYIGKHLRGFAEFPDGSKKWLIDIADWDFNWQADYQYTEPVFLPKGTRIMQRFSYDNSSSNPRNPVSPPRRVRDGPSSLDEMGEMWLQVLPRRSEDRDVLFRHFRRSFLANETRVATRELERMASQVEVSAMQALEKDPGNWTALLDMARSRGFQERFDEAVEFANRAVEAAPNEAGPHCMLGHLLLGRDDELAFRHLTRAIQIRPDFVEAHISIGLAWKGRGSLAEAERAFATAHDLAPENPLALFNLALLVAERGDVQTAIGMLRKTLKIEPRFTDALIALERLEGRAPR